MIHCANCGKELTGWSYTFRGKHFCDDDEKKCLKEYLVDKLDSEIGYEPCWRDDYSMDEVAEEWEN